ncbi:uncharacterized protein CTRU02_206833 [Colletotrichum truncatum]|uniref:Uncharacterized protein n=1 Tax=Colletotrichum truncatum TaxID=5467 RepID=A0ACC3YZ51_COLTU
MSRPFARSSGGCWTCRIRHRKCDECSPACKECTDRHIKCHGYGPEPDWVKDSVKLRAELQRIKHAVKQNFRQTRKLQAARSPQSALNVAANTLKDDNATPSTTNDEFREAELLMHYLDYIFPLQYAYYVDKPATGGRGWLFWLLSKRGPLRHAAFTLSALHQHSTSHSKTEAMESELIRYHTSAMQELRQVLSHCEPDGFANHPEHRVEFLTCGTFLISFEIFQGGTSKWEPHLNALVSVASQIDLGTASVIDVHSPGAEPGLTRMINAATRFHMAQLLWFELTSCVATGKAPKLPYREWLDLEDLDMSCVMGSQNWAMLALGDVAVLETQLREMSPGILAQQVSGIMHRLRHGIEDLNKYDHESPAAIVCQAVTRVYATAIFVQLQTLSATDDEFEKEVFEAVEEVIDAIQRVPKGISLRGVTWPLCVAGAPAKDEQQPFFRSLLEEILEISGTGFTNCGTVLEILKESWKHQDGHRHDRHAAKSAMERLGISALLV